MNQISGIHEFISSRDFYDNAHLVLKKRFEFLQAEGQNWGKVCVALDSLVPFNFMVYGRR